ncbi:metal ABC transporter solute-binding protein, Zn/Mn family [Brachybacterium alimentarium]|uniref:metal ABC transporter solute-binding protein, Zn/Mn family n=1 Tax=Brachybacterium alimentarium TaxID=47845 RepID=UPI00211CE66F|nr:zinc ABC transporter substrate-binding protein [Brachybacterium alimentarium]
MLTTFTVLEDIAENVAGDHPVVESMTEPGAEVHGHEPTPGGIRKASEAGPILDYGLNLEAWFGEEIDAPHRGLRGIDAIDITWGPTQA